MFSSLLYLTSVIEFGLKEDAILRSDEFNKVREFWRKL